jgi:hypothetical protein
MDPHAPVTALSSWGLLTVVLAPWAVFLAIVLITHWHDRRAARRAEARWAAWRAAHPREPTDDRERRWQLRDRLYLDSLKPYLRAHILRERLAEAEREARVEALLAAERTPQDREDNARPHVRDLCG